MFWILSGYCCQSERRRVHLERCKHTDVSPASHVSRYVGSFVYLHGIPEVPCVESGFQADRACAERCFAALPERYVIYVPIFGSTAEILDHQTGTKGAFDDVMRAVSGWREDRSSMSSSHSTLTSLM